MTDLPQVYRTPAPNDEIPFDQVTVVLRSGQHESRHQGSIGFSWLPEPGAVFQIHDITTEEFIDACKRAFTADQPEDVFLRIDGSTQEAKIHITKMPSGSRQPAVGSVLSGALEVAPPRYLSYVLLHFPNVKRFVTTPDRTHKEELTEDWCPERIVLEADKIRLTIEPVDDSKSLADQLRRLGGYAITHVGKLEATNGALLPTREVKSVMHGLFHFLSFICGSRVQPILPVGFDVQGRCKWKLWANWQIDPWKWVPSWCDRMHGECVAEVFPGFMKRYADPLWEEVLTHAIHWYVISNRRREMYTDDAVVLTQAALEMLASAVVVEDPLTAYFTKDTFDLKAAQKIRCLLNWAGIPLAVPDQAQELQGLCKRQQWRDGAQAITETRNCIVHATLNKRKRIRDIPSEPRYQVCSLALWYLELVLLRLFAYSGVYANRLKYPAFSGTVEPVPWARDGPATTT